MIGPELIAQEDDAGLARPIVGASPVTSGGHAARGDGGD